MVLEKLTSVVGSLNDAAKDAEKFDRGNSAAGARVRKQVQFAVKALKELRKVVSELKAQRKADKQATKSGE